MLFSTKIAINCDIAVNRIAIFCYDLFKLNSFNQALNCEFRGYNATLAIFYLVIMYGEKQVVRGADKKGFLPCSGKPVLLVLS